MVTALERRPEIAVAERVEARRNADELGRALLEAVLDRKPAVFTVEAGSARDVTAVMSPLRVFLLMFGRAEGQVSATVSPRFSEETYPAMLDVVGRLSEAGGADLWRPEGARSIAVGPSRHIFVSADMPVAEHAASPDGVAEIVEAHRIPVEWFRTRVAPRLSSDRLVKVFYGRSGVAGSVFDAAQAEAMADEAISGKLRRFSLAD
jgi:hypothetical protein